MSILTVFNPILIWSSTTRGPQNIDLTDVAPSNKDLVVLFFKFE